MINIDEVTFTTKVLNNRSWLKRGVDSEIFSQKYCGSVSVVMAINSEGDYFAAILIKRLNSVAFIEFLKMTNSWIETYNLNKNKRVLVILDNCPIRRSFKTTNYMKETNQLFIFLPVYTPSLAPVELIFSNLKQKISCINTNEVTNWNSSNGTNILKNIQKEISSKDIIN